MTSALTNQRQVFKACLTQMERVSDDVTRKIGPLDFNRRTSDGTCFASNSSKIWGTRKPFSAGPGLIKKQCRKNNYCTFALSEGLLRCYRQFTLPTNRTAKSVGRLIAYLIYCHVLESPRNLALMRAS